jgi:hypothetical protein
MSKACGCNMRAFHQEMQRREAILNGTGDSAGCARVDLGAPVERGPTPARTRNLMLDAEIAADLGRCRSRGGSLAPPSGR